MMPSTMSTEPARRWLDRRNSALLLATEIQIGGRPDRQRRPRVKIRHHVLAEEAFGQPKSTREYFAGSSD